MEYAEFQRELRKAGLSVVAFAKLVGMQPNSVSNYAKFGVPHHLAIIVALLAEMESSGVDFRAPLARLACSPKKPRGGSKPGRFGGSPQTELELES